MPFDISLKDMPLELPLKTITPDELHRTVREGRNLPYGVQRAKIDQLGGDVGLWTILMTEILEKRTEKFPRSFTKTLAQALTTNLLWAHYASHSNLKPHLDKVLRPVGDFSDSEVVKEWADAWERIALILFRNDRDLFNRTYSPIMRAAVDSALRVIRLATQARNVGLERVQLAVRQRDRQGLFLVVDMKIGKILGVGKRVDDWHLLFDFNNTPSAQPIPAQSAPPQAPAQGPIVGRKREREEESETSDIEEGEIVEHGDGEDELPEVVDEVHDSVGPSSGTADGLNPPASKRSKANIGNIAIGQGNQANTSGVGARGRQILKRVFKPVRKLFSARQAAR